MPTNCEVGLSREQRAINRCNKRATGSTTCGRKRRQDVLDERWLSRMKRDLKQWLVEAADDGALLDLKQWFAEAADDGAQLGNNNHRALAISGTPYTEKLFGRYVPRDEQFPSADCAVSIALFDGDEMLFACSGIALPDGPIREMRRFVTSTELVRAFNDKRNKDDKLRIEVRLSDNTAIDGFLGLHDDDIAIVTSFAYINVCPVNLFMDPSVIAEGGIITITAFARAFQSGLLMCHTVETQSYAVFDESLKIFTPDFTEAGLGAPVYFGGSGSCFLGMYYQHDRQTSATSFLPVTSLYQRLMHFGIFTKRGDTNDAGSSHGGTKDSRCRHSLPSGVSSIVPSGFMRKINWLKSVGYPIPPPLMLELNGILRNTFEEVFGEVSAWKEYGINLTWRSEGNYVWQDLPKKVHTNISRRVVSVVSFNGDKMFFACTGLLISWHERTGMGTHARMRTRSVILTSASLVRTRADEDEIDRNLRIEIFLPPHQRVDGRLELYHLNYNIAVISVDKHFYAARPENIFSSAQKSSKNVVAVGREVTEGLLLAAMGVVSDKPHREARELDCKDLQLSTCKIKKVGIGGPLINSDNGSFVGMNFYDETDRTPFLPRSIIVDVLRGVDLPSQTGLNYPVNMMDDKAVKKNRWPVPEPYWYHPLLDEDLSPCRPLVGRQRRSYVPPPQTISPRPPQTISPSSATVGRVLQ